MLTNLEKLNRLAAQRYEDGVKGLQDFSNDFLSIKSQLECLNTIIKDKAAFRKFVDSLYEKDRVNKEDYQKLIALINGIEVV